MSQDEERERDNKISWTDFIIIEATTCRAEFKQEQDRAERKQSCRNCIIFICWYTSMRIYGQKIQLFLFKIHNMKERDVDNSSIVLGT